MSQRKVDTILADLGVLAEISFEALVLEHSGAEYRVFDISDDKLDVHVELIA